MMTDTPERLRDIATRLNAEDGPPSWSATLHYAADEIEVLCEAMKFIVVYSDCHENARDIARQAIGWVK